MHDYTVHDRSEVVTVTTDYTSAGMPAGLVCIGTDRMAIAHCLKASDCQTEHRDAASIWFLDHDYDTVTKVSPTFEQWIRQHLEIGRWRKF